MDAPTTPNVNVNMSYWSPVIFRFTLLFAQKKDTIQGGLIQHFGEINGSTVSYAFVNAVPAKRKSKGIG
jgi:hypothetical protein